jgi:hypothetical protein
MNPFEAIAVLGTVSVVSLTVFGTIRVIARSWSQKTALKGAPQEELLDMIERMQGEIEGLREELSYRVDDLEERADFSERLLRSEPADIPAPRRSHVIGLTPI